MLTPDNHDTAKSWQHDYQSMNTSFNSVPQHPSLPVCGRFCEDYYLNVSIEPIKLQKAQLVKDMVISAFIPSIQSRQKSSYIANQLFKHYHVIWKVS